MTYPTDVYPISDNYSDPVPPGTYEGGGDGVNSNVASVTVFQYADAGSIVSSGNQYVDNLIFATWGGHPYNEWDPELVFGSKWGESGVGGAATAVELTYSFSTSASVYMYGGDYDEVAYVRAFNSTQKTAAVGAMQAYMNVSLLTFTATTDTATNSGDIRWNQTYSREVPTAHATFPSGITDEGQDYPEAGDIWMGTSSSQYLKPYKGGYGYHTFIHELGHSLGLYHPHNGTIDPIAGEDQIKYSIMSYRSYEGADVGGGYTNRYSPTTLMINDIAAIQYLYGVNTAYNSGDTTYWWDAKKSIFETIWDGGGSDTISAFNQREGCVIDLNPGEWSEMGVAFEIGIGMVRDCLTIAYNCDIENAIGSKFDDTLNGNGLANTLNGGLGNDTLKGGLGNDILIGGGGNDELIGDDSDIATAGGDDTLSGGLGSDIYWVDSATDLVTEVYEVNKKDLSAGIDLIHSEITYTLGDYIENLTLEDVGGAIDGTGNALNNVISGNGSVNTLIGHGGDDTIDAGGGNDEVYGGDGNDTIEGGADNDTIDGGDGKDILSGDAGDDTMAGGAGNDELDGGAGTDTMTGGLGDDTYWVGEDIADTVTEDANQGTDHVYAKFTYTAGINIENLTLEDVVARGEFDVNDVINETKAFDVKNNINGIGNDLNNVIIGNVGKNVLNGGIGADTMSGEYGNDTYYVDDFGDLVEEIAADAFVGGTEYAVAYTDTVHSTVQRYQLTANVENLTLDGVANIDGYGNALDNVIEGNTGINELGGGLGDDTYYVQNTEDRVVETNARYSGLDIVHSSATYTLSANIENLDLRYAGAADVDGTGNELNNMIWGSTGINVLHGGAGNDEIDGYAGVDDMYGDAGDDIYWVDDIGDTVNEDAGEGADLVNSTVTFSLDTVAGANIENLTLIGFANIDGTGNALDNYIEGNTGNNVLTGLDGNDTLNGGYGDDTMIGGDGNDTYYVLSDGDVVDEVTGVTDAGIDLIYSSVDYTLGVNQENLTLSGSGNTEGTGNAQNNTIIGSEGDNLLNGGGGTDTLVGGRGNDTYVVDGLDDVVTELRYGGTADTIETDITYTLADKIYVENLTLTGVGDIDATGNASNNMLTGNTGDNVLTGGLGNDTYIVQNATDQVVEYAKGGVDEVRSVDANYSLLGTNVENLTLLSLLGGSVVTGTGNELANLIDGYQNSGANELIGGLGNDTYIVGTGDTVTEAASGGTADLVKSNITYTLDSEVENLTLLGTGDINGTGNVLGNIITGNSGNNILTGAGGADRLTGGAGNDTYVVNLRAVGTTTVAMEDVVIEALSAGTDTITLSGDLGVQTAISTLTLTANVEIFDASGTDDTKLNLTGNVLNNTITGNLAANVLNGGTGNDTLVGGAGNDRLIGGLGNDVMQGGADNDTYVVDSAGDTVTEGVGAGVDTVEVAFTYTLGAELDNLLLTGKAAINGTGNVLVNTLTGNAAANILDGGVGADTMIGGKGNDTYVVDDTLDVVTEYAGSGTGIDLVQSTAATYTLLANVENLTLMGTNDIDGTGNVLNNTLTGNSGLNVLTGSLGNDTYVVQNTTDTVVENASEGTDTVRSEATYTLSDDVEYLTLIGTGNINGTGNDLANIITGNVGDNILDGGVGDLIADSLRGGMGDDTYVVDLKAVSTTTVALQDAVVEYAAAGVDTLQLHGDLGVQSGYTNFKLTSTSFKYLENLDTSDTGDTKLNLYGNAANNEITGNDADNIISGAAGIDTLIGGLGNDILYSGLGNDTLTGGAGNDKFTFDTSLNGVTNVDAVMDFTSGADQIQLQNAIFTRLTVTGALNVNNFVSGAGAVAADTNDYIIHDTNTGGLYYDADGSGVRYGAVKFATLIGTSDTPVLADFLVI